MFSEISPDQLFVWCSVCDVGGVFAFSWAFLCGLHVVRTWSALRRQKLREPSFLIQSETQINPEMFDEHQHLSFLCTGDLLQGNNSRL